jgi:hypothetical protein
VRPDDDKGVSGQRLAREGPAERFLDLYDRVGFRFTLGQFGG